MTFPLEEARRARTWNLVIAAGILGADVAYQDIGHDRRWESTGGFCVDRRDGGWWCFGSEEGGYSAVRLVHFLLRGSSWTDSEAWLRAFLAQHPGTGPCNGDVADDDETETRVRISTFKARQIRDAAGSIANTDGARYLQSRGIDPPYPLELRWLPNARTGEGAIVVDLIAADRPVGILVTFIDALGKKSAHQPNRRRFNLEPGHPGAGMRIAEREPGSVDQSADIIVVEGLENGLSIARVKKSGWQIIALPGIGALSHLEIEQ
jgi:hypothetical protein